MVRIQKPQGRNDPAAFYFPALAQIVIVDLGTIANVATAMTVIVGVVFGLVEMRRSRREREERAAFAAVQAFMTPEWMSSSMIVHSIPKGTTAAQLENDPRLLEACLKIATIMEGIGHSVYARIVPLSVAADLIGGTARIAWQNFRPFAELERTRAGTQKVGSGSNGWWNNSNATMLPRGIWRWVHQPFTATGNRNLRFERRSQNITEWRLI